MNWVIKLAAVCAVWISIVSNGFALDRTFGVIEIGGSGVKASVVEIVEAPSSDDAPSLELRIVYEYPTENLNPAFEQQIGAVAVSVARRAEDIARRYALPPLRIYVVGASGLHELGHAEALRAAVDDAVGANAGRLRFVSVEDQARFGFNGVVNCERLAHRRAQTVFIDVGSSETIAAATAAPGGACGGEAMAFGSLGVGVKVTARSASGLTPDARMREIEARVAAAFDNAPPTLALRDRVYLGGGIVWALATFAHPQSDARYVPIRAEDIAALRRQLAEDPLCITDGSMAQRRDAQCRGVDIDFSAVADAEQRIRVSADHREIVTSIYTLDQLRAGADILSALSTRLDLANKTVFFARPAVRAWMLGFLLEQETGARASAHAVP